MRTTGLPLRIVIAAISFFLAAFFLVRSSYPLRDGYFSEYPDSPDGLYFTIAGIGAALGAIFATMGLLVLSRRLRVYGGFLLLAAAAAAASSLPALLFKWAHVPHTWPWVLLGRDSIGWLRLEPLTRNEGIAVQIALGLLVALALAAQIGTWQTQRSKATAAQVSMSR
jgi:hypothetical protein